MGKKSREKREQKEAMSGMTKEQQIEFKQKEKEEKEAKREEQKTIIKNSILMNLKMNWKGEVQRQYKKEPDKVINSDIEKNANNICSNFQVKTIMRTQDIQREDIIRILTEIRDEVITENKEQ
jgi:hypothetical protein